MRIGASASISASAARNGAIASRRDGIDEDPGHRDKRDAEASICAVIGADASAPVTAAADAPASAGTGHARDDCGIETDGEGGGTDTDANEDANEDENRNKDADEDAPPGISKTSRSDSSLK
ncbi:Uncharacterised protein [Burkholderia pseudomallei]|uniref:Uncharacterized protein n=1 Tax=Burkholderia pseudomallei (strain 1710b) TaxID=320372 RepID=Q3JTW1_BURP1|nr:hypothetical protein BURPS1710b_1588 [Burkholderia pseudomallei 1710b]CAJ6009548.1 Uncharacterised protein [Burkholderia pseudomallei]CAJ8717205.1 Uncharacterised protein [Burkholderia pseudomallei]